MSRRFFLGLLLCLGATFTGPIFADDLTQSQPGGWDAAVWDHLLASSPLNARLLRAGDIILTWDYVRQVRDWLKGGKVQPESAFDGSVTFWPGGVVYYAFASDITTLHRKAFTDAAADWSTFANITFVQRTTQSDSFSCKTVRAIPPASANSVGPRTFHQCLDAWPSLP